MDLSLGDRASPGSFGQKYAKPMTFGYRKIVVPPRFVTPPVPRCAASQPRRYEVGKHESRHLRNRLNQETVKKLDFHGTGGNVDGFRALLAHKHAGSAIRGWRKEMALEKRGTKPISWQEFCLGLKRVGFTGRAKELWSELSDKNNGVSASICDFDPPLARQLDIFCRAFANRFERGAPEAWQRMKHKSGMRSTYADFADFVEKQEILPESRRGDVNLRRIFDALDLDARGLICLEDLRFLDTWSEQRFGIKAPDVLRRVTPEEVHWSPPPKRKPHVPNLTDLRAFLTKKFGSPARAWRAVIDMKGQGDVTVSEFGMGCRQAGFHHKFGDIFLELERAGDGVVDLRAFDPETVEALDALASLIEEHFGGDCHALWHHLLDPAGTGAVSRSEFVQDLQDFGLEKREAELVFMVLDVSSTGWLSVVEWGSVRDFIQGRPRPGEPVRPRELGYARPMSHSSSDPGLLRSRSLSMGPSPSGRALRPASALADDDDLFDVCRPTRSGQWRAFHNSHKVKHRWIKCVAAERVQLTVEPLPPVKRNASQDIFRHSCDFYRKGVQRLAEDAEEPEDEDEGGEEEEPEEDEEEDAEFDPDNW